LISILAKLVKKFRLTGQTEWLTVDLADSMSSGKTDKQVRLP
jgi:hypothetical protein